MSDYLTTSTFIYFFFFTVKMVSTLPLTSELIHQALKPQAITWEMPTFINISFK